MARHTRIVAQPHRDAQPNIRKFVAGAPDRPRPPKPHMVQHGAILEVPQPVVAHHGAMRQLGEDLLAHPVVIQEALSRLSLFGDLSQDPPSFPGAGIVPRTDGPRVDIRRTGQPPTQAERQAALAQRPPAKVGKLADKMAPRLAPKPGTTKRG